MPATGSIHSLARREAGFQYPQSKKLLAVRLVARLPTPWGEARAASIGSQGEQAGAPRRTRSSVYSGGRSAQTNKQPNKQTNKQLKESSDSAVVTNSLTARGAAQQRAVYD